MSTFSNKNTGSHFREDDTVTHANLLPTFTPRNVLKFAKPHMPENREIRADYDESTIVVYQAFREAIAAPAVAGQKFVPPFSLDRMTWIKPSFLWMMERSGWGTKPGQEHVLAVRITRIGWEDALNQAVLSDQETDRAPVRVQWDPERSIRGAKLPYRSIQVGLGRHIVRRYVEEWVREIRDVSDLVSRLRRLREAGEHGEAERLLPPERVYPVPPAIRARLRMDA